MSTWTTPIGTKVLDAITAEGFRPEMVTSSAAPDTNVVLVVGGVLNIYLRGRATAAEARIKAAIENIPEVLNVFDRADLDALHSSHRLGNLVAEPREPYDFSTTPPANGVAGLHGTTREIQIPLFLGGTGVRRIAPRRAHSSIWRPPSPRCWEHASQRTHRDASFTTRSTYPHATDSSPMVVRRD